ncbi:hypothetical protein H2204_001567 [Knufia peltigerae]|uniref:Uncharacterized protein n=1 Tax=Knufia peltigerae TaxID=1002370 RepID=A0AA38YE32_9EURO|nr:hypothetical protein H2204_001567 [Knufia peltigerae]
MALDFGANDIIAGVALAKKIYEINFVEDNRADYRFQNFRKEIKDFEKLLKQLDTSLAEAARRYKNGALAAQKGAHHPGEQEFERERQRMTGDFEETLKECQVFLLKHRGLLGKRSNFGDNMLWHATQQDQKIDSLRSRIHMHSTKIKLVIDRLSIDLLTNFDARIDDLFDISLRTVNLQKDMQQEMRKFHASLVGVLAGLEPAASLGPEDTCHASPAIEARFEESMRVFAPPALATSGEFPLSEGFDALLLHFEQSFEGREQTPEMYLSLLKTRWLLARLKKSKGYTRACAAYYYKRAVHQVEQAIEIRLRDQDIMSYSDEILMALPESMFLIWPPPEEEEVAPELDLTAAQANEQELLRLQLASRNDQPSESLMLFRRSTTDFRLVHEKITAEGREVVYPLMIYTEQDQLIPRYAMPTLQDPCFELAVYYRKLEYLFKFKCLEDALATQTALTGYDVSHDQSNITCEFNKAAAALDCKARVQLWQDPIPTPQAPDASSVGSPTESFSNQSARSRQSSYIESIGASASISQVGDGLEAESIRHPALLMTTQFTDEKHGQRFAIMFVDLETSINIDTSMCKCHSNYDNCSYICLRRRGNKPIPIRILFTECNERGLPDPTTFNLLPFRLPRGEQFRKLEVKETQHILLRFKTLAEKDRFHHELRIRFYIRAKQVTDQHNALREIAHRQDRPVRAFTSDPGASLGPRRSTTSTTFSQTSAPRIDLDHDWGFEVSLNGAESEHSPSTATPRRNTKRQSTIDKELGTRPLDPSPRANTAQTGFTNPDRRNTRTSSNAQSSVSVSSKSGDGWAAAKSMWKKLKL